MIEFSELIPTMEHAMQGSVVFATLAHGVNIMWQRITAWLDNRKWAAMDAQWAASAKEAKANLEVKVETVIEEIKDTVKKSKKNG